MKTTDADGTALIVCEHHEDFHVSSGCYAKGSVDVMVNTNWGPEPGEDPICPCEAHLAGKPEHVIRYWRKEHNRD